ncbi:MAG: hypothetical protein RPU94_04285 [Candidatus Sedimenticola sp. (ex Thyasira tokunagai)]
MTRYYTKILLALAWLFPGINYAEMAIPNAPLKKEYKLNGTGYKWFSQTGEIVTSYSIICNMGQALPDPNRENWYINKPISGLKLELRARAARRDYNNSIRPLGFVVVTKNKEVLITFSPLGDYVKGLWEGDTFNSWSGSSTEIEVFSERYGRKGYASFDLLDGNGFFYKSSNRESPNYFLSECKRIKKSGLPVYGWK